MPDAINSVVLGDPASFAAEHSEREPQIVFLKPITDKAAQTNLLISTTHGSQASLLLISQGEAQKEQPNVDFEMRCRPAGRFIIDPSSPSVLAYGGVGHRIYHGSPWIRHFAAAGMALVLSGLLRLAEFFVQRGVGGIR
jgi:hypothetical protein